MSFECWCLSSHSYLVSDFIRSFRAAASLVKFGMKSAFGCIMQMKLMSSFLFFDLLIFWNTFTLSWTALVPSLLKISPQNFISDFLRAHLSGLRVILAADIDFITWIISTIKSPWINWICDLNSGVQIVV